MRNNRKQSKNKTIHLKELENTVGQIKQKLNSAYVVMQLYGDQGRHAPRWFIKEGIDDVKGAVELLDDLVGW